MPYTFTKIIPANNQTYCNVIPISEIKSYYNDQTLTNKDICLTICNGDYDAAPIAVKCAVYQSNMYIALLDSVLNAPIRVNGTVTVNKL